MKNDDLLYCPACDGLTLSINDCGGERYVRCYYCGLHGPRRKTRKAAIAAFKRRLKRAMEQDYSKLRVWEGCGL